MGKEDQTVESEQYNCEREDQTESKDNQKRTRETEVGREKRKTREIVGVYSTEEEINDIRVPPPSIGKKAAKT